MDKSQAQAAQLKGYQLDKSLSDYLAKVEPDNQYQSGSNQADYQNLPDVTSSGYTSSLPSSLSGCASNTLLYGNGQSCPNCGYCRVCGRSTHYPYYYGQPYTWTVNSTTAGAGGGSGGVGAASAQYGYFNSN